MFARTQMAVDRLVEQLREIGVRAGGLHGGKTQRVRTRTLEDFKEGRTPVLVATDVAARGIHVDGVSLVLHIDPPKDSKDYLHRAGRTARAGESGAVATLVLPKQRRSTLSMMLRAGVSAPGEHRVRLADPKLIELTGAREPSGTPVVDEPRREDRQRSGGGFRGRREGGQRDSGRGQRREFGSGGDRREGRGQGNRHEFGAGSGGARREFGASSGGARREFGGNAGGARREFGAGSGGARREFRGDAPRGAGAGRRDRAT
jgi:superfamily II DNA/RNA helicase